MQKRYVSKLQNFTAVNSIIIDDLHKLDLVQLMTTKIPTIERSSFKGCKNAKKKKKTVCGFSIFVQISCLIPHIHFTKINSRKGFHV